MQCVVINWNFFQFLQQCNVLVAGGSRISLKPDPRNKFVDSSDNSKFFRVFWKLFLGKKWNFTTGANGCYKDLKAANKNLLLEDWNPKKQ